MDVYTVVGRSEQGDTFYYTGRAGQAFVSKLIGEAFAYPSLFEARRRALNLNRMTALHGIRFFVPVGE